MRLPLVLPLLRLVALASLASSSGAPRASIDGVPPVFDIAESYIRSQTDGSAQPIGFNGVGNCSSKNPCILGSCCNSDGQCGYRPEHCSPSSPKTCVANCDAKAPCGEFSADGKTSCPLNVCCSRLGFCGTLDVFCRDTAAIAGVDGAADDPSCGKNSGSASRRIAYYQSWNSRTRGCDKLWLDQLDLSGITHIVLAFATIDPKTFKVGMMDPADDDIYKQLMALPGSVSKWIGIGGFQFTDPGPTQHTFSDITSTKDNRKAFIDSLKDFLSIWKFSGVDIDWEWPGHPDRGGSPQDGANQVELFKEMRQALGSNVGLGVVIPAQYEYMKNMDPKGLEAQVDWLTILTYDLHGPWDASTPGLEAKIKPHTDLKEVDSALKPLWSSQIDSEKVNMGIANYGRGFTVADKQCEYYGCSFTGPSKQGACTAQPGVLSACEIRRIIDEKHLSWKVIDGGAETNEVSWDDQWVSWDDAGTLAKKLALANDRCLGGTALWAIDYDVCPTDGGSPQPGLPGSSVAPSQAASSMASASQPSWSAPSGSPSASSQPSWSATPSSSQPAWSASSSAPPASSQSPWPAPSGSPSVPPSPSQPVWSTPSGSPTASPQPSWSAPSASPSGTQGSSAGPSSGAPSYPASSAQGTSQMQSSSSVDSSSPAPVWPVPSSGSSPIWSATPSSEPWTSSTPASSVAGSSIASSTNPPASSGAAASSSSSNACTAPVSSDSGSSSNAWTPPASSSSGSCSSSQAATSGQASTSDEAATSWIWSSSDSAPPASLGTQSQGLASSGTTTSGAVVTTSTASETGSSGATASASSSQDSSAPWNSWNSPSSLSSSGAQSAPWASSSVAQTTSTSATSSNSSSSSGAASSGSSSAQSSAAQSSADQSSAGQSSAGQSSAGQSSAAQTSKPAETSKGATSGSGDTTTAPPPALSATTGVATTLSTLPPGHKLCPDQCWGYDWCKVYCNDNDFVWPPPLDCWHYDWCMLWWGFTDNKIDEKDDKKCKILGCGCGWMGLPWGPGCPKPDFPFFIQIIIDLFGLFPSPCLFWGCGDTCGIFGCFGYCFGEEGCIECPKELCPHGGGPEPGPIPSNKIPHKPAVPTTDGKPPKKCYPEDYKTATERFVFCHNKINLSSGISATTISTWASTTVSTSTSSTESCETPMDYTISGCNVVDHMETKTVLQTKSNSLSSETPGPACTRAPLSLDDDEGNNIPLDWDSSSSIFGSNTTAIASQTFTSTSSAPPSPSIDCGKCWRYWDQICIPQRCKPDDPIYCAYRCLTDMCTARNYPQVNGQTDEDCWNAPNGNHPCANPVCPDWNTPMGPPQANYTCTLTFKNGPTLTVTIPSGSTYVPTSTSSSSSSTQVSSSLEIGTSDIVKPTPTPGPMDKNGQWNVTVHIWFEDKAAKIEWELYDPNKNKAGEGKMYPQQSEGDIFTYIESYHDRALEHQMPFGVNAWFRNPVSLTDAVVQFEIQKPVPNCPKSKDVPCKPNMQTENKFETQMFLVNSCYQYCKQDSPQNQLLKPSDLNCDDLNDAGWQQNGNAWMRNFNCRWKGF